MCTLRELWQRGQWEEVARLADRLHALRPPLHACAHPDVTMALDAAAFHLLLRARPDIRPEGLRLSVTARGGSAREVADRLAELEAQAERVCAAHTARTATSPLPCVRPRVRPSQALEALDREAAQRCLEGASALLLPLRQAAQCVELLALPSDAYHRLCLQRGMARGDYSMVATATCALKEGLLSAQAHKYRLSACPLLRTPHEFAGAAAGAAEAGRGMLSHSPVPLRRSLTVLPPTLEATALQLFRCVLGFAGERRYSYPAALAQQLVAACAAGPQAVRDEVYCQLMKQCTDNPDVRSRRRVWLLMALAVAHFPPSDALENFLECFLRAHGERECVRALHLTAVAGPRTQPPAVEEIEALEAEVEPQLPSRAAPPALADGRAATPFRHAASDL